LAVNLTAELPGQSSELSSELVSRVDDLMLRLGNLIVWTIPVVFGFVLAGTLLTATTEYHQDIGRELERLSGPSGIASDEVVNAVIEGHRPLVGWYDYARQLLWLTLIAVYTIAWYIL